MRFPLLSGCVSFVCIRYRLATFKTTITRKRFDTSHLKFVILEWQVSLHSEQFHKFHIFLWSTTNMYYIPVMSLCIKCRSRNKITYRPIFNGEKNPSNVSSNRWIIKIPIRNFRQKHLASNLNHFNLTIEYFLMVLMKKTAK